MIDNVIERVVDSLGLTPLSLWSVKMPKALEAVSKKRGVSPAELVKRMDEEPALVAELANHLMVHETHFMRHPSQFDCLAAFLEQRVAAATVDDPVVVWSAGCASGEEPYTVAMLAADRLPPYLAKRLDIVGTDRSAEAIAKAEAGVYGEWSFRDTPHELRQRYFRPVTGGENGQCLDHAIRSRVRFRCATIEQTLSGLAATTVDVVFFRNVSIYLSPTRCQEIYQGLGRVLRQDGLLIVSPSDLRPQSPELEMVPHQSCAIFRRRVKATSTTPSSAQVARALASRTARPIASASTVVPECKAGALRTPAVRKGAEEPAAAAATPSPRVGAAYDEDLERAKGLASGRLQKEPANASLYVTRGLLAFAADDVAAAVRDLRSALFLRPGERIARFWYAVALSRLGLEERARAQLESLERDLEGLPDSLVLEDGASTARELHEGVTALKEEWT